MLAFQGPKTTSQSDLKWDSVEYNEKLGYLFHKTADDNLEFAEFTPGNYSVWTLEPCKTDNEAVKFTGLYERGEKDTPTCTNPKRPYLFNAQVYIRRDKLQVFTKRGEDITYEGVLELDQ